MFHIPRKLCRYKYIIIALLTASVICYATVGWGQLGSPKNDLPPETQKHSSSGDVSSSCTINSKQKYAREPENVSLSRINWRHSTSDSKHIYTFLNFVVPGNKFVELSKQHTVCIATQSSLDRLYSIVNMSQHWTGPISVAAFIAGEEYSLTELYITYLRRCFPHVKDQISFHLAYSEDCPPSGSTKFALNYTQDCSNPEAALSELLKYRNPETVKWRYSKPYPQNHLRNQARSNCQTEYIYLVDADIIPCNGMADNLDVFLRTSKCEKCAYVIPVYEIKESVSFPHNKSELLKLVKNGTARPFHQETYKPAQFSTDYVRWEDAAGDITSEVHVSHNVTKCEGWYEPFYVAHPDTPAYDERFIGYGFTRNTQFREMVLAGYQFHVLSPIFSWHWGLGTRKTTYDSRRRKQVHTNMKLIRQFNAEVSFRYPNVKRTC